MAKVIDSYIKQSQEVQNRRHWAIVWMGDEYLWGIKDNNTGKVFDFYLSDRWSAHLAIIKHDREN